jgi:glycine cleavage system aminomethyltransferase T
VWIWTLHKLWFTPEQINEALNRIIENNFSKFHKEDGKYVCIKNEQGKIMKPEWFTPVYLEDLCK